MLPVRSWIHGAGDFGIGVTLIKDIRIRQRFDFSPDDEPDQGTCSTIHVTSKEF